MCVQVTAKSLIPISKVTLANPPVSLIWVMAWRMALGRALPVFLTFTQRGTPNMRLSGEQGSVDKTPEGSRHCVC